MEESQLIGVKKAESGWGRGGSYGQLGMRNKGFLNHQKTSVLFNESSAS